MSSLLAWVGSLLGAALFAAGGYLFATSRARPIEPKLPDPEPAKPEPGPDPEIAKLRERLRELETAKLEVEALRIELEEARAESAALRRRVSMAPAESDGAVPAERLLRSRLEEAVKGQEQAETNLSEARAELRTLRARLGISSMRPTAPDSAPRDGALALPQVEDREGLLGWLRGLMEGRLATSFAILDQADGVVASYGPEAGALTKWGTTMRSMAPEIEESIPQAGTYAHFSMRGTERIVLDLWVLPSLEVVACVARPFKGR